MLKKKYVNLIFGETEKFEFFKIVILSSASNLNLIIIFKFNPE